MQGHTASSINVTPLIDILLVLLIIFMVITPLTPKGLQAIVPETAPTHPLEIETPLVLELTASNMLRLTAKEVRLSNLALVIRGVFSSRANKVLFVKADQGLEYRQVAELIDVVKGADPSLEIGLVTPGMGKPY